MYVILINDDNSLSAPKKQRIVQRSKLVDTFWFLVKPMYNGYDMTNATVLLEYLKPMSKKYCNEILVLSDDKYEDHLKYTLPVDTELTDEHGEIELQLSFIYVDIDVDGKAIQRVRKTAPTIKIHVTPISAWSDIIPDSALSALDQRIIKTDAQIKALNDMNEIISNTKADNLAYDGETLQLTANGKKIGDSVDISSCYDDIKDGVPVVDFNNTTDFVTPDDSAPENKDNNNVVEFDYAEKNNVNNVVEF
jgi:hypothetical protein